LKKNPTPDDAADALAAAFCNGNFRGVIRWL
jgi:crossover junction endodeoxyribonuclease RuvC